MPTQRDLFDRRFRALHERSKQACETIAPEMLFARPTAVGDGSFGEYLLRSAGAVEQTFGGITSRLWDDPFEWTLPEELSSREKFIEYLEEVEATRRRGFSFFGSDADLGKRLAAPDDLRSIFDILLETLARAEHFQGRAFGVFRILMKVPPPRV